jgi:hypothetical protein
MDEVQYKLQESSRLMHVTMRERHIFDCVLISGALKFGRMNPAIPRPYQSIT